MNDITGRDDFIIAGALYEYIRHQQSLPKERQQWSNEQDAKAILMGRYGDAWKKLVENDKLKGITPPDLTDEKEHSDEITPEAEVEAKKLLGKL